MTRIKAKVTVKESESRSESKSESDYVEEEEEESDESDTESFLPEELYQQQPKPKQNGKKAKKMDHMQKPKQKRTRALTQKQPKRPQTQDMPRFAPKETQLALPIQSTPGLSLGNPQLKQQTNKPQPKQQSSLKQKQEKLTPKLRAFTHHEKKERIYLVNLKCSKGFERLLENSLSSLFYDSKHPDCPSLKLIEHKLLRKEYKTIYDFGYDLRQIWSFYFKFYASSPQYYQLTYNMSEYCDNVITELEEMPYIPHQQETKRIDCLSIEEKEELGESINLLSQADLKKLIQLFDNDMAKKDGKKKMFEFDINSLPNETQMKMYRFVRRCLYNQVANERDYDKEEKIEMERIRKLKNDLGILSDTKN